jgi:hypothetical protein
MPTRFFLPLLLLAAGCLGPKADPTRFFVLAPVMPPAGSPGAAAPPLLGLGPVTLPDYLDQTGVVTRVSEHEIVISQGVRWAERLGPMLTRILAVDLSARTGGRETVLWPWPTDRKPAITATVDFTRFALTAEGTASLRAQWRVSQNGSVRTGVAAIDEPAADTTMNGRVAALNRSLARLSEQLAEAIVR